jgi:hypothetical protein
MHMPLAGLGQNQVNVVPAPGVEGDFANANPRFNVIAGPGGLIAGVGGVTAGRFCWQVPGSLDVDSGPQAVVSNGGGLPLGIVHRAMQGLIPNPLVQPNATLVIPQGFMVSAFSGGDFWVRNAGTTQAVFGQKAYARFADGAVLFAATGSPPGAATSTASTIAAATFSVTGSITGNVLNVTAVSSGTVVPGAAISGTGIVSGTTIGQQLSGTTGGIGTYSVSIGEQSAASTTVSGTYGLLTIGGTLTGTYGVGQVITGGGTSGGTFITGLGTGTGGFGNYYVNNTQTVGSGALNGSSGIETKFFAMSGGLVNELVKISDHAIG